MPKTNDQIKVSEPWSLKSRNSSTTTKTFRPENEGSNRPGNKNPGRASKESVAEGAIVDVVTRNRSNAGDKPFDTAKENLSQKVGRGRNPGEGGRVMGSFSQKPNTRMSRNASSARKEEVADAGGQVSKGRTSQRAYPKRGANASGRNSG